MTDRKSYGSKADLWEAVSKLTAITRNLCCECGWPLRVMPTLFEQDHKIINCRPVAADRRRECPACGCVQPYMRTPRKGVVEPSYSKEAVQNLLYHALENTIVWAWGRKDLVGKSAFIKDTIRDLMEPDDE